MSTELDYTKLDHPNILEIVFHPRKDPMVPQSSTGIDHIIEVEDNINIHGRFHLAPESEPHILFFHGNGEIADEYDDVAPHFVENGLSLLSVDYRGYGKSDGSPTVSAMFKDCHIIYKYVKSWIADQGRTGPLFIMGRSLGSASAIEIAYEFGEEITGLIIESGFAQTMPLLLSLGVNPGAMDINERDGFKNVQKLERVLKPTFILHGQKDSLLPMVNAEILHRQCGAHSKELQVIPGADHNTMMSVAGPMYFAALKQFANKVLKIRPKKRFRTK